MSRSQRHADAPGGQLSVHLAWRQDRAWLVLTGELDRTTVHHVQDALREITLHPGRVVHLDVSRLIFADAAGARALYLAVRQLRNIGRQVRVAGCSPRPAGDRLSQRR